MNLGENLNRYKSIVFDCDGVILNSNQIKTDAFYDATVMFGSRLAGQLKKYHTANGGISRYEKFQYFFRNILKREYLNSELDDLIDKYSVIVSSKLRDSEVVEGLNEFRERTKDIKWHIVSGGDQEEIRNVFEEKKIKGYFDGGIFGSPDDKISILKREINAGNISLPALFLGDSKYDFLAASTAGLDFMFIYQWTELENWDQWCFEQKIAPYKTIVEIK